MVISNPSLLSISSYSSIPSKSSSSTLPSTLPRFYRPYYNARDLVNTIILIAIYQKHHLHRHQFMDIPSWSSLLSSWPSHHHSILIITIVHHQHHGHQSIIIIIVIITNSWTSHLDHHHRHHDQFITTPSWSSPFSIINTIVINPS